MYNILIEARIATGKLMYANCGRNREGFANFEKDVRQEFSKIDADS